MSSVSKAERDAIDRIIRNTNKGDNNNNASSSSSSSKNPYLSSGNSKNPYTQQGSSSRNSTNRYDDDENDNSAEGGSTNPSATVAQIDKVSQDNVAKLKKALQYSNQSNEIADDTSGHLARQKETIERTVAVSEDTKNILSLTKKTLRDMKLTAFKERMIKFGIIGALIFIIIMIIYFKFLKGSNNSSTSK